jgi:hypothetical protein
VRPWRVKKEKGTLAVVVMISIVLHFYVISSHSHYVVWVAVDGKLEIDIFLQNKLTFLNEVLPPILSFYT